MTSMAQLGLAGSGNAPYGVDLVCYPLLGGHAPDLTRPMFRVVRERYIRPALYKVIYYSKDGQVEREELTEKMPLRDKKATGYRYERSQDERRIRAVNLIFEFYDSGMKSFGDISEHLWNLGLKHYDKPFGFHGVESILRNPIYTGRPAWGKVGVGTYYIMRDGQAVKPNRKAKDPYVIHKDKGQYVQPPGPLWEPIVPLDLWERVQGRLDDRPKDDPAIGMRRQRSTLDHPLNGKIFCPDCGNPMVKGASQSKGYKKEYFLCGLYRRSIRKQCKANSIPWSRINEALEKLLEVVRVRLEALTSPSIAQSVLERTGPSRRNSVVSWERSSSRCSQGRRPRSA